MTPSPGKYTKKGELRKRRKFTKSVLERKTLKYEALVNAHDVRPGCDSKKCARRCSLKISAERWKILNDDFWKLQTANHVSCNSPHQRTALFDTEFGRFRRSKLL